MCNNPKQRDVAVTNCIGLYVNLNEECRDVKGTHDPLGIVLHYDDYDDSVRANQRTPPGASSKKRMSTRLVMAACVGNVAPRLLSNS